MKTSSFLLLLLLQTASASASASASAIITKSKSIQSLPLIPHHSDEARRRRRRRELSTDISNTDSTNTDSTTTASSIDRSHNRKLATTSNDSNTIQLGALYQGYGTHYIDLWVGTPPQRQTLIVDTGSGVTAFPCSACDPTICGKGHHIDDFFQESNSSSYEKVSCENCQRGHCSGSGNGGECKIGMSYQEGSSWSAFEATDQVYIGGPHTHGLLSDNGGTSDLDPNHAFAFSFPMTFGCQTKITGLFKTQLADGIMGMDDAATSFWAQMFKANIIDTQRFALCFTRQPLADRKGTEAGAMTMGGVDARLHSSPMIYTGRVGSGKGFYNVHVRKIYIRHGSGGDRSSSASDAQIIPLQVAEDQLNHGNVIVDSGTTDTYFTRRIATEFNAVWKQLANGRAFGHTGMVLTETELLALPTILIQLAGDEEYNQQLFPKAKGNSGFAGALDPVHPYDVLLAIPPSHYMEYDDKTKKYVARFYADEGGGSVLGANAMMGHDVFFDLDNKRIGWAESDCDYHELITTVGGFEDSLDDNSDSTAATVKPETTTDKETNPAASNTNTNNAAPDNDPSTSSNIHPAIDACNDAACRGTVVLCLVGFLAIGLAIGRGCNRRSSSSSSTGKSGNVSRYHDVTGDLELSPSDGIYRDDPDDDDDAAAPEGTGYSDNNDKRADGGMNGTAEYA